MVNEGSEFNFYNMGSHKLNSVGFNQKPKQIPFRNVICVVIRYNNLEFTWFKIPAYINPRVNSNYIFLKKL